MITGGLQILEDYKYSNNKKDSEINQMYVMYMDYYMVWSTRTSYSVKDPQYPPGLFIVLEFGSKFNTTWSKIYSRDNNLCNFTVVIGKVCIAMHDCVKPAIILCLYVYASYVLHPSETGYSFHKLGHHPKYKYKWATCPKHQVIPPKINCWTYRYHLKWILNL